MCHGLKEARGDTVQHNVDAIIISHHGMGIESIDVVQVFVDSTCLFEMTDLVKSPVWFVVVAIVFSKGVLDLFLSIESILVRFPLLQCISFYR